MKHQPSVEYKYKDKCCEYGRAFTRLKGSTVQITPQFNEGVRELLSSYQERLDAMRMRVLTEAVIKLDPSVQLPLQPYIIKKLGIEHYICGTNRTEWFCINGERVSSIISTMTKIQ